MSAADLKEARDLKRMEREALKEMDLENKQNQKKKIEQLNHLHRSTDMFKNAYEGRTELVLIEIDRNPDRLNELGNIQSNDYKHVLYVPSTVLHFACRGNRSELAYELVKRGADPHSRNHLGDTPLTGCDKEFSEKLLKLWEHNRY